MQFVRQVILAVCAVGVALTALAEQRSMESYKSIVDRNPFGLKDPPPPPPPATNKPAVIAVAIPTPIMENLLIIDSSLAFVGSVRKWPHPEVVSNVAPQPVQTLRFDDQKKDDQAAEQD